jgi:hypothetical protein
MGVLLVSQVNEPGKLPSHDIAIGRIGFETDFQQIRS